MVILQFSMQVEDIMKNLMAGVICYTVVCKRKIFLRMLMSCVLWKVSLSILMHMSFVCTFSQLRVREAQFREVGR